ncbi:hypothetical protein EI94DRAFT_1773570 [Lactarius quietus]|nr:hypothetical protein EI94DRAFT_1773570 [Lactarius quietus]
MSFAGCTRRRCNAVHIFASHLTFLMLTIIPPISLGAMGTSVFWGQYSKLSNKTQEALGDMSRVSQEALEEKKFSDRFDRVLTLTHSKAVASWKFFGSTGWSRNVALLALLGYTISLLIHTVSVGSGLQTLTVGTGTRIFELLDRTSAVQPGVGISLDPKRTGPLPFAFSYPTQCG